MQVVADIRRAWKDGGPSVLLTRSLRRAIRPAARVGSLVFIECDLRARFPERRDVRGITFREAKLEDAHLFTDRRLFIDRFNQGHRCFMGIEEATGKLTNYRWVNPIAAYVPELHRYLVLKPGEVYVYDLNTLPEFRRRGIDAYTRHCLYSYLRDTGYTKVWAYIHGDNRASLNASQILLRRVGRVWYVQLPGCMPIMLGGRSSGFPEISGVQPPQRL
jgi:ribosomal protein S18 acetylase RimI-like enzyme